MRIWIILVGALLLTMPAQAQFQRQTPITPANARDLTIMAELSMAQGPSDHRTYENIAWSPSGDLLAVAVGNRVLVYDFTSLALPPLRLVVPPLAEENPFIDQEAIRDIAFHPTQPLLATATHLNVYLWDLETGEIRYEIADATYGIAFNAGGEALLLVAEELTAWNYADNTTTPISISAWDVATSPDGTRWMTWFTFGRSVSLIDSQTYEILNTFAPQVCDGGGGGGGTLPNPRALTFSDATTVIAVRHVHCGLPVTLYNLDITTGEVRYEIPLDGVTTAEATFGGLVDITSSPRRDVFAWTAYPNLPTLHATDTGEQIVQLPYPSRALAFHPDGHILATMAADGVRLWTPPENVPTRAEAMALSQTIIDATCDGTQSAAQGRTISIGWSWYATTPEQLAAHIVNVRHFVTVEDTRAERWIFRTQPERAAEFDDNWTTYYYMPIGDEPPGTHTIVNWLQWQEAITDGYANYGPDTNNPSYSMVCQFTVQ